jgi:nucleotide-binding universal stress UspA family protein
MYQRILIPLDGTLWSNWAMDASIAIAKVCEKPTLIGCHVYGAQMHRTRFGQMEPGLPEQYQSEQELSRLRGSHEDLITDGMQIISDAYLNELQERATKEKMAFKGLTPEGRNYREILKAANQENVDLIVLGAHGHGHVPEAILGSNAERIVTYHSKSDVLLIKKPLSLGPKPILVCVDGSQNSYHALIRAATLAQKTESKIKAVAVYDPYLHSGVFTNIAGVLPIEKQEKFNFTAQEKIHDEIINDGLEELYHNNLKQGVKLVEDMGVEIDAEVLSGKVFPQLHHHASLLGTALIVVGRWGLHKEELSLIGSNTHSLAMICTTNLLVVSESLEKIQIPSLEVDELLEWTHDANKILERIPDFAREMAKRSIEKKAREQGLKIVDDRLVQEIAKRMGMKREGE